MDSYSEQIVKQSLDAKRIAVIFGVIVAAVVLCGAALLFMQYVFLPLAAACGFGVYWVATSQFWEVEYTVTNGDIDIERIIARRQRKTIVRVRGNKIEHLLPIKASTPDKKYDRVVMAANSMKSATWYFTYYSKKNGSTIVYFEPNAKTLSELRDGLSRTVSIETDRVLREL